MPYIEDHEVTTDIHVSAEEMAGLFVKLDHDEMARFFQRVGELTDRASPWEDLKSVLEGAVHHHWFDDGARDVVRLIAEYSEQTPTEGSGDA